MKYVIIAETTDAALKFAELNKLDPTSYKIGKNTQSVKRVSKRTVIFVDGWRARKDAFQMVQLVNEAEIRGVKIIEAKADQVLEMPDQAAPLSKIH